MDNVIEIEALEKKFGRISAVKNVSLAVPKGEIFGFLGENGAGKTTTIRCMMNFIRPTSGSVKIFGLDAVTNSVALKSRIGYLSGNVRLYDKWTGQEHIELIESIQGESKAVGKLIERLSFNPKIKFRNLSSGNKQKLGLILALMSNPDLLIMDEPTVGLDPLLQNEIYEIFRELRKKGTSIFLSSHNLPEVEKICDQVGIIKEGEIIAVETISALADKKIHLISLKLSEKDKLAKFEKKDGIEEIEKTDDGYVIRVSGDISPILRTISRFELRDIEISHASLEDVFLKYYRKED